MATIDNTKSNTLLSGTNGDDTIRNGVDWYGETEHYGGSNVTINTSEGNDYVYNYEGSSVTINTGEGNDSVYNNWSDSVTINTGAGNDYVYNEMTSDSVTINTDEGNDTVHNGGSTVTVNTGSGDDSVWNMGRNVSINTGAGDDSVYNWLGESVTISGGKGNDSIYNYEGNSVTISGGKGNDSIYNYWDFDENNPYDHDYYGNNVLFKYAEGDGNDLIYGFKKNSTLSIAGGSYSTTKSGDDIIVTVGDGKISLVGAATLSTVNIKFKKTSATNSKLITLTEGNDTYSNSVSDATISALGGKDTIYNYANNVSISGGVGNDYIQNSIGADNCTLRGGDGNDTISNNVIGNMADGNIGGDKVLIDGGEGNDSIINDNDENVTLLCGAGDDTVINWAINTSINGGDGKDLIYIYYNGGTITGGKGNDTIYQYNYDESLGDGILYRYGAGDGNDYISGFSSSDTLSIGGGSYSTKKSGKNIIVTVGDGKITLAGVTSANIKGTKTTTEKNSWQLSGTTATYGTSSKTLVTVKGVKSADGLSVKNKIVTIAASALNKSKVTISNGYTLKLGSDVSTTATTSNDWSYKSSVATLKQTKGEKYSLASNGKSISYSAGTSKTLTKVSGVKSADGLSVKNKVVTIAASALNKSKVTINGGYKLALGSDVYTTAEAKNTWSYSNSVATLKQTRAEYYSLAGNKKSITYSAATSKNLAKVSGVKSAGGLKVSGKIITVPNAIIAKSKKVTVNGGGNYEFKFAAQKTLITGSANADIITSNGANSTINGGKGNDQIKISGANNVIVYKSGDGRDTISNYSEDDTIKITSGTATPTVSGSDIVFSVGNGSVLFKGAADKTVSYVAGGVKKTYTAPSAEPYTVKGAAVILASSYAEESFDVANDVDDGNKIVTIDASAVSRKLRIKGNGLANSIKGGAGNDTLRGEGNDDTLTGGKGADVFIYYDGDGEDVITDYEAKDTIRIYGSVSVSTLRSDVVLSVGAGKVTVQDAFEKEIGVTYVEGGVEHDYINGEQTVVMNEKKTNATLTKNYWKTDFDFANFGKSISTVDATQVMHNLKITGNDKPNLILGGSEKNTLAGGGGNDTLQGGDKADIFVYSAGDGNDILYNVGANDTISIVSGTVDFDSVKGDTVIFTVGNGKISVEGGAGNKITYCDEHGKTSKLYSNPNANVVDNWLVADDDNFATDNDLSSIIQSKAADYSVVNVESALRSANALATLTCSTKT